MDPTKILIGGTFLYIGTLFFFLLEHFLLLYEKLLQTIGVLLLITGGIITIVGIISKEKNLLPTQSPKDRNCLKCGKTIPFEASIYPYCKYDFTQIKIDYPKDLP